MKRFIYGLFAITLIVGIGGCRKTELDTGIPHAYTGHVTGLVTAQNANVAIPHALVFVDLNGEIYHTYTDASGEFDLEAPAGNMELHVQTGDGSIFRTVTPVTIQPNLTVPLPGGPLKIQQNGSLAYISGIYDEIEAILSNLGYSATQITTQDLDDLNYIAQFDAIFMNCGTVDQGTQQMTQISNQGWSNLNTYAMSGGSLYASDWAVRYFTGEFNGSCANGRPGGFILDSKLCTEKNGLVGWEYGASIDNASLSSFVGLSNIDLQYDLGGWEQVVNIDNSFWETLVSSSTGEPLMIRTSMFDGSASNDPNAGSITVGNNGNTWVTICHIPPGNPSNPITITISTNALQAHLNHGDNLGACNSAAGGNIYFTTFHNHPGGAPNTQMNNIMEWVIMNM